MGKIDVVPAWLSLLTGTCYPFCGQQRPVVRRASQRRQSNPTGVTGGGYSPARRLVTGAHSLDQPPAWARTPFQTALWLLRHLDKELAMWGVCVIAVGLLSISLEVLESSAR